MTLVVPPALEDAVWDAARAEVGDARVGEAALARSVVDRSARYTSDRARLDAPDDPLADLAARATFFTVADALKVAVPIRELVFAGALPAGRPLRVVDVGAGCGAMILGLLATLPPGTELEVVAIDRDARALRISTTAIRRFAAERGSRVTLTTRAADVTAPLAACDLVLLGSVLNELGDAAAAEALVQRAFAAIAADGAVIAIEPALRETSRALHGIRDAMLAGGAHVFAPCTRAVAPCPALADERDWCHEDRAVTLPPRTAALARRTGLRDAGLRFSYLVLRRTPEPRLADARAWRIVSAPMTAKGKLEVIGCSTAGRVPIRLLKRNRADGNRLLERARRGDVLTVGGEPDGERAERPERPERLERPERPERVEVTRDTSVDRIDP